MLSILNYCELIYGLLYEKKIGSEASEFFLTFSLKVIESFLPQEKYEASIFEVESCYVISILKNECFPKERRPHILHDIFITFWSDCFKIVITYIDEFIKTIYFPHNKYFCKQSTTDTDFYFSNYVPVDAKMLEKY